MTEDMISKFTLECLTNEKFHKKYYDSNNNSNKKDKNDKKDKIFYKKRIYNMTKNLLSDENCECISKDVLYSFDLYIKSCINYFKTIDKTDICQEEYAGLSLNSSILKNENENENENEVISVIDQVDKLLQNNISIEKHNSLEKFIKKTIVEKPKEKISFPKKKKINLKDPILKTKGIPVKENEKEKKKVKHQEENKNET
jgi:hypothetical protein